MSLTAIRLILVLPLLLISKGITSSGRETIGLAQDVKKVLMAILILVCEGHVGQIHPRAISLEQLIRESECIFVVRKGKPYSRIVEIELDDSKRFPPHKSPRYAYKVLEILKDETDAKPIIGAKIEVLPAHDRMMLNLSRRYHLEGVHKSPILEFYNDSAAQIEKREKFIVFLRWNGEDRNHVFAAGKAVEAIELKSAIDSVLNRKDPDDATTPSP